MCNSTYTAGMSEHPDAELITAMGGPVVVAGVFEIAPQAVSAWKRRGIPKARRMYLELARPDVFRPVPQGQDQEARDAA
jgi:hypothetical protein